MEVEIINIGDELLIGQVINTNAAWMAEQLNFAGFSVRQLTVISDDHDDIIKALSEAETRASIILVSGGIGPTSDDITKTTLCDYFGTKLIFNEDAFHDIEMLFTTRNLPVTRLNRKQAELPGNCISIPNKLGTARGMWFEKPGPDGSEIVFVSMPGVPFEMKAMMTGEIIPRLHDKFRKLPVYHKTVLTQGIGESFLAAKISSWESAMTGTVKLAYLPQPGLARIRLTARGDDEHELHRMIDDEVMKLKNLIPDHIYGYDEDTLEEIVGKLMMKEGATLGTAESCTGGYIAHLITSVPGSSGYFKGSVVAYSNEIKHTFLGVTEESLMKYGAVSEQVVTEMAIGLQKKLKVSYVIATSGIAGPDGGTTEKPVGSTWIAIASPRQVNSGHYLFGDNRERNIRRTALQALNMLRRAMV